MAELPAARVLMRASRFAMLATSVGSRPHAALVTPACMPDGAILLLLSELSRHTSQLHQNPHCSMLCLGEGSHSANPQTHPRLSLSCVAVANRNPALLQRYLHLHPYARLYAGFSDFVPWRLTVEEAHFVGGFARAWSANGAAFAPAPADVETIAQAEAEIVAHCNSAHAGTIGLIGRAYGSTAGPWQLAAIDVDGCNLICGERSIYVPWAQSVASVEALHTALREVSGRARDICGNTAAAAGASGTANVS